MRKILEFAEQAFTVVFLILYSGGPLTLILTGGANEGEIEAGSSQVDGSLIIAIFFLNYLVTFFLLVLRWKKVFSLLSKDRFIWVLLGFVIISAMWSANPSKTITRNIAIIGTSLFGLYLATRYSMKQQLQLLGWAFGIAVVLSFIFAIAMPKYGIMGGIHAGKWRGIYNHKNGLGKEMILSFIIFLLLAIDSRKNRFILWGGVSLSIILLVLSNSKTSLVNLFTVLAAFCVFRIFRLRYHLMIPTLISTTVVGVALRVWLKTKTEDVLGALGKDASLTGRGDLWPLVWDKIWQRPWLGYGYSGFWYGWEGESSSIWYALSWHPPSAHNGFLDLLLNLGIVGVAIFGLGFLANLLRGVVWVRRSRTSEGFWPLIYLLCLVLANLAESSLMEQNDLFWVLYIAISYSVLLPPEGQNYDAKTSLRETSSMLHV